MPRLTATIICAAIILIAGGARAQECPLPFERVGDDWAPSPIDANTGAVSLWTSLRGPMPAPQRRGPHPQVLRGYLLPVAGLTGATALSFEMYFPPEMPADADVQVYIKDRHYWWFQAYPLHRADGKRDPVRPGSWMSFTLDVSRAGAVWEPGGHRKAWGEALYRPREFGIRIFADRPWQGWVLLDNVRLTGAELPLGRFDSSAAPRQSWGLSWLSTRVVPVYEKLEVTFDPGRVYTNPFDPEVVDVTGRFLAPSGRELIVPGFFYQDFERSQTAEGFEKLIPVGAPCWKLRFAPTEEGRWKFYVSVRDVPGVALGRAQPAWRPRPARAGARGARSDLRPTNGDLFVPHVNMRDGGDQAEAQQAPAAFDYFPASR